MSDSWTGDYKGYGITPGASSSDGGPYTAAFTVMAVAGDGTRVALFGGEDFGAFSSTEAAWEAGRGAAQVAIDGLVRLKGPADAVLACDAIATERGRFRGRVHFANAEGQYTRSCIESDRTREEALERAKGLPRESYAIDA